MTAAFDNLGLRELVELLTQEEQSELRPVVLRLVASHGRILEPEQEPAVSTRRFSFAGTVNAGPGFASTSEEVLRRELGGPA